MKQGLRVNFRMRKTFLSLLTMVIMAGSISMAHADEDMYRVFMNITQGKGDSELFEKLNARARNLDWDSAKEVEFEGNLRLLKMEDATEKDEKLYMVRSIEGELYLLSLPPENAPEDLKENYSGLDEMLGNKF
ncbi:MAG TPA: hypothetical protein VKQ10_07235, partial [Spirochaetota bacterium]|nr:hypothetical protein [Spirochaetota bacterium]